MYIYIDAFLKVSEILPHNLFYTYSIHSPNILILSPLTRGRIPLLH